MFTYVLFIELDRSFLISKNYIRLKIGIILIDFRKLVLYLFLGYYIFK